MDRLSVYKRQINIENISPFADDYHPQTTQARRAETILIRTTTQISRTTKWRVLNYSEHSFIITQSIDQSRQIIITVTSCLLLQKLTTLSVSNQTHATCIIEL